MNRLIEKTMKTQTASKYVKLSGLVAPPALKKVPKHMRGDPRPYFEIEYWGFIVIDAKYKRFEAHCGCFGAESTYLVHCPWCPVKDHRTATIPLCTMQRVGTKRPLGFLVAWLREGYLWDSHAKHLEGRVLIKREQRIEARTWLEGKPEMAALLEQEKLWCGEAGKVEEPLLIV